MMTTPGGTSEPDDLAGAMASQFERLFGMHNYPPEMQKRMAQNKADLDLKMKIEADEMLDNVDRLSIAPDEEKAELATNAGRVLNLNFGKRKKAELVYWITRVTSDVDSGYYDTDWVSDEDISDFLAGLNDAQFKRVTDLMHQYPSLHVHSKLYVRECLKTFATQEKEDIDDLYELLMLGTAIYSELNAATDKVRISNIVSQGIQLARGIVFSLERGENLDDPIIFEQMAALFKFAFSLQTMDKNPGYGMSYVRPAPRFVTDHDAYYYEDAKLVKVIREHADKVDRMIAFSEKHHDIDPEKLRALVEGNPIPNTRVKI